MRGNALMPKRRLLICSFAGRRFHTKEEAIDMQIFWEDLTIKYASDENGQSFIITKQQIKSIKPRQR